ncbi:VIT family protein [Lysobacter pythonis]|uniref:VIT family protein n=1 Tax=Solilutibacter pythonis TaxID=2483112 RepID=A0A3M2I618_9GAMM|nr:VIT family protein [Lysobacter pythonis]RMH93897.1 VIT family protein [Lysobacter pythonis]
MASPHHERHRGERIGWLRAAVLGANDGLISTSSLLVGIAAAGASPQTLLMTGIAGLTAGALSMAAGEYVSVGSQADSEAADRAKEKRELEEMPDAELKELTHIYIQRGLSRPLAEQVAEALTAHDALGAHLRDELGMAEHTAARPVQAALASAAAFAAGAAPPLLLAWLWAGAGLALAITLGTLSLLAGLGALAGWLGGASMGRGAARVLFWGSLAMGATAAIGKLFGAAVG